MNTINDHCKNLKHLKVFGLVKVVDNDSLSMIANLPNLKELDIGLCSQITDEGLEDFTNLKHQQIEYLNLTGLIKLTNKGLNKIISENNTVLRDLNISLMPQKAVDGDICSAIGKCKKLNVLDISGCIFSNDSIGGMFSGGLEDLENVNMSGIPNVNDATACDCISANKNLKIFRLSNCYTLTAGLLEYIIGNNNELLLLEINRTPLIPDLKIEETIKKRAPNLRIIRSTNVVWNMKNIGYKVPLLPFNYVKPLLKGSKKPVAKKNDDKNPVNQLKKLMEEVKPKKVVDFKI